MKLKDLILPSNNVISENTDLMDYYRMVTPIQAGIMKKISNGILPENLSDVMEDALTDLIELKLVTTDGDFLTHMGKDVLVVINDQGSYKLSDARNKLGNLQSDDIKTNDNIAWEDDPQENNDSDDYIEIA